MAFKKDELAEIAIKAITSKKLVFMDEVYAYLPCSRATFYNHKLEELDSIKGAIEKNRVDLKVGLRKKWYESENATVQIALYKLIGSEDESDRINSQKSKIDHTTAGKPIPTITVLSKASEDELKKLYEGHSGPDSQSV